MASGGDPVSAQRARGSNPRVKESTVPLLQKAARSVAAAKRLLEAGDNVFAASRAYYAMFYVAEALLSEKGLHFRKHAAVHGGFAENFVKTSALDAGYHRWLLAAFNKRIAGDYGIQPLVAHSDVEGMIEQALGILGGGAAIPGTFVVTHPFDPIAPRGN